MKRVGFLKHPGFCLLPLKYRQLYMNFPRIMSVERVEYVKHLEGLRLRNLKYLKI